MTTALTLIAALLLDVLLGDPNRAWHPVRLLGRFALGIERSVYSRSSGRMAGFFAFCVVVSTAVGTLGVLLFFARRVHPLAEFVLGAFAVYFSIAPRDLATHANRVYCAINDHDLQRARLAVGSLVGRDTQVLDETGVSRAAVEAVAESVVDGVTAPLFWACVLGPLGAIGYRAVNTLDSLWGHKDTRYKRFGLVAARADDVANWVPARLTLLFIATSALLVGGNAKAALVLGIRQGPRHASPNSGLSEAAFAGALGVTLGGSNRYDGLWQQGPTFGTCSKTPTLRTLRRAVTLMWVTTYVAVLVFTLSSLAFNTLVNGLR